MYIISLLIIFCGWDMLQMPSQSIKFSKISWGRTPKTPLYEDYTCHFFSLGYASDAISEHQIFKNFLGEDPQTPFEKTIIVISFRWDMLQMPSQSIKFSKISWGMTPKSPFEKTILVISFRWDIATFYRIRISYR